MKINQYFTADWHIGHKNILKFCPRPWENVDDMKDGLIKRYNATVGPDDVCWHIGDCSMNNSGAVKEVISQLNGKKILILGNHDNGMFSMYEAGFDAVMYNATIFMANERITMSHCPLQGLFREDTKGFRVENPYWHGAGLPKNARFTMKPVNNSFHLHGHIHSPNEGRSQHHIGRQYDVGVDANKYTPVSQGTIEKWIHKFKTGAVK